MPNCRIAIFIVLTALLVNPVCGDEPYLPMPDSLVPLQSKQGRQWLYESEASESFWQMCPFHETQQQLNACSAASSVTVLNSLPIERPQDKNLGQFRFYTCDNFFNESVNKIVTREKMERSGMTLDELTRVLQTFPVEASKTFAADSNIANFRENLSNILADPNARLILNYYRPAIGQQSRGHFSPVAAYHKQADRVLVLDTATYKYPWVWVPVDDMWKAIVTPDKAAGKSRGYIVIRSAARGAEKTEE